MSSEDSVAQLRRAPGTAGPPPQAGSAQAPDYDGRAGEVAGIALVNGLLGVVTLGFYRFWGKTRLRRYLWGRASFDNDPFEYTGTGMELFVGFLVAIAVLIPLSAIANIIQVAFPTSEAMLLGIAAVQALVIAYLVQFAIYRARRYRLTRTQWRGIRGGQSGSALKYALAGMIWAVVTGLTLGFAYPVMRTRLQRYRTENTWLGTEKFSFEARAAPMFGRWLIAWLLFFPTLGLSYAWYRANEFRYFAANTRYGGLAFRSDLSTGRVVWIWLRYLLVLIAIFAVIALVISVLFPGFLEAFQTAASGDQAAAQNLSAAWVLGLFVAMFLWLLAAGVAQAAVYLHPMLAELCRSLSIEGKEDFGAILQSQQARPSRGEGFADALDVGSF